MKSITIRRTKNSKINGSPILQLPPRIDHIKKITLSKTEQDYYRCIQDEARELFETDLVIYYILYKKTKCSGLTEKY